MIKHTNAKSTNASVEGLRRNIAVGALFDAAERCDAPRCYPETRVAVREEIISWALHRDADAQPRNMMWVNGVAGGGKSAIMGSVAGTCHEQRMLAASFFFSSSGSAGRRYKTRFVTTLAYQLLRHGSLRKLRPLILRSISRNASIFDQRLVTQMEQLILKPLRKLGESDWSDWPKVILIDGLDECQVEPLTSASQATTGTKDDEQTEILRVLKMAADDPAFPFRIVIASRPEKAIRDFFQDGPPSRFTRIVLDKKYHPSADIALFIRSKLSQIRLCYGLPASWGGEDVVRVLVKNASGQFIYAVTVMRFIRSVPETPQELLDCVLGLRSSNVTHPFASLDALYTYILHTSPNPVLASKWLQIIDRIPASGSCASAKFTRRFLESYPGETEDLLGNLHSLVYIPAKHSTSDFRFYHKSLFDFLGDQSRSGDLYVSNRERDKLYLTCLFRVLQANGPTHYATEEEKESFLCEFVPWGYLWIPKLDLHGGLGSRLRKFLKCCDWRASPWSKGGMKAVKDDTGLPRRNLCGLSCRMRRFRHWLPLHAAI